MKALKPAIQILFLSSKFFGLFLVHQKQSKTVDKNYEVINTKQFSDLGDLAYVSQVVIKKKKVFIDDNNNNNNAILSNKADFFSINL